MTRDAVAEQLRALDYIVLERQDETLLVHRSKRDVHAMRTACEALGTVIDSGEELTHNLDGTATVWSYVLLRVA